MQQCRQMQADTNTSSGGRTAPPTPAANGVKLRLRNAPLTFRLPRQGETDPYFSLNRSAWNELILPTAANSYRPPIKSIVERKPGNAKGRRLIVFASARLHFERLLAQTESEQRKLAEGKAA